MWSWVGKYCKQPAKAADTERDVRSSYQFRFCALANLKIKKTPPETPGIIILNRQSQGAYFSVNVLIPTNDHPLGAGNALTHWGSWLTQALLLILALGRRRQWDSRHPIHCRAGPTILALWLWSSQAKYSYRQVFLAVKRDPVFIRLKKPRDAVWKWASAPQKRHTQC